MQCRQCGAATRPGMAQCPNCGAQLTKQDNPPFESYQPQQGYVPGGAGGSVGAGAAQPPAPDGGAAQRRPPGSLSRRLQQSAASAPPDTTRGQDDMYPPQRGPRSRPLPDDREAPRGYGAPDDRGRRSRPSTDGRRRRRGYDDDYGGADDRAPHGYEDDVPNEAPGWGEERGRRTPSRWERERGGPPDDESEEMRAWRDGPRPSSPRRRGGPDQAIPPWDDHASPLDDPRAPPGLRGSSRGGPSRRPGTPAPGGSGRGPSSRYDDASRRGAGRSAYPDEGPGSRYDDGGMDGYSEEYEARPRSGADRRGQAPGGRGPRSAPGGARATGRDRGGYGGYDEYDAPDGVGRPGGYGRGPARPDYDTRDAGGFGARYPEPSGYTDFGEAYPPARGGQMGRGARDAFEAPGAWPPGDGLGGGLGVAPGARARGASDAKPDAKRKSGPLAIAFRLLTIVMIVVGLVTVVGPELAPKLGKYLPFLGGSAQTTPPPTFATYTPGPTPTNLPNYKLFTSATKGYAMSFPSAWGTNTLAGSAGSQADSVDQFTQSGGPAVVSVERAPAFDSATDAQLIQAEVQGAQAQGATLTEITGAATTEGIGGEVWQRHEYKAATKGGAKLHIAVLACHHLGKGFVIALISSDTAFASNDTAIFEPMLRSFRFL